MSSFCHTTTGLVLSEAFSETFASIVFKLVLVGKVALAAVLLYVLSSKRIFYYFMTVRNIFEEEKEEGHWQKFRKLIIEVPSAPESFDVTYNQNRDSKEVTAMIFPTDLFGHITGRGKTPEEAKENLRKKIQSGTKSL